MNKKLSTALGALLLTTALSTSVIPLAAEAAPSTETETAAQDQISPDRHQLTEQQKADIEAHRAEIEASRKKYEALTGQQKAELTTIQNQIISLQKQLIQKYVEFGVLTKTQGDAIISRMDQAVKEGRSGWVPGHHGRKHKEYCSSATTSSAA